MAVAVLILVLAVMYLGAVVPLRGLYADLAARVATDRLIEPRLRGKADELAALRSRAAELRRTSGMQRTTLEGGTDALAAASLQSHVEALAAKAGVAIASSDGLPSEPRSDYRRIGIRLSLSGTYGGIVNFLSALESATPPLVLDNLQIHGKPPGNGSTSSAELDVHVEVYGFRNTVSAELTP